MNDGAVRVRLHLEEFADRARRDARIFAVCVILLTPLVVVVPVALLLGWLLAETKGQEGPAGVAVALVTFHASLLLSAARGQESAERLLATKPLPVLAAALAGVASGGLLLFTSLLASQALAFWSLQAALVLIALACLGALGPPTEFTESPVGFLFLVPVFLLENYAVVFAPRPPPLDDGELSRAARCLEALTRGNSEEVENLLGTGEARGSVLAALRRLGLVRAGPAGVRLSARGEDLVGEWVRG